MTKGNIEAIYPLSPLQQGMLFHTLYDPGSRVYVLQLSYRLRGQLDASVFRQAWQYVTDRNPVLRTSFLWERRTQPLQVVRRSYTIAWAEHDWRRLSSSQQLDGLRAFLQTDREHGFDLAKVPPVR